MLRLRTRTTRVFSGGVLPMIGAGLTLLFISQSLTSCGSDDDDAVSCRPDDERSCTDEVNGCEGTQFCLASGTAYSPCECGNNGSGGSMMGSAGNGGGAGSSMGGNPAIDPNDVPRALVGLPCVEDNDCAPGLECVASTDADVFPGGSAANGYCTTPCTDDAECETLDLLSACALPGADGSTYCAALCQTDNPQANEFKCHLLDGTRDDLACYRPVANPSTPQRELGICVPMCHSDVECGEGLFCNLGSGTCVSEAPQGGPIGAACDPDGDGEECASGVCIDSTGTGTGACSGFCTFGTIGGCGFPFDAPEGTREAACLEVVFAADQGFGDFGLCRELCDTTEDCEQAGWTCEPLTDFGQGSQEAFGRTGYCAPPNADADAGGG